MVSVAFLISIMFAFVTVSHAEEVASEKGDEVDAKWLRRIGGWGTGFGGLGMGMGLGAFSSGFTVLQLPWLNGFTNSLIGGCYGYGFLGGLNNNIMFAKATDGQSVSRRAITLDADQLSRRSEQTVSCVNEKGTASSFLRSDCIKAANQLAEKKISSASHGSCTLSLVSPKERVAPKQISGAALERAVEGILEACSSRNNAKQTTGKANLESDDKQVVMLLSKGHRE